MRGNGPKDPLCVVTTELARVMEAWVRAYNAEYPQRDVGLAAAGSNGSMSAMQVLAMRSGLDVRQLARVAEGTHRTTTLTTAELIVVKGMRRPELMDNEVHVIPNPRWTQEHWVSYMAEMGCEPE